MPPAEIDPPAAEPESGPRRPDPRRLDPGHRLIGVAPPRKLMLGRLVALSTCAHLGAVAIGLLIVGVVLESAILVAKLVGAELKGFARYGELPFHLACLGAIAASVGFFVAFYGTRRRHFRLVRDGEATVGRVAAVEVLSRHAPWRRGSRLQFLAQQGAGMGRYRIRYRYRAADAVRESEDVIDSRHGNGDLCMLPEPRRGDRLTVLFDPDEPDDSVLALGIGEGLRDP